MQVKSRRKAREAALRALYEIEVGHIAPDEALDLTLEEANLAQDLAEFAARLIRGVRTEMQSLDARLEPLISDFAYDRLAVVDRNIMRIAAFELFYEPSVPPAVTLNEAVEVAKKYSTAESGKFVNGVLGRLLLSSPKVNWNPASAPAETEEPGERNAPLEIEEVEVNETEAKAILKVGGWTLRTEDRR